MICRQKLPTFRARYVLYPAHNSEFYNPNNIRRRVGITKHPHVPDFSLSPYHILAVFPQVTLSTLT